MCAWKVCLVCQNVEAFGQMVDKRIHKTTCGPFCLSVLMDWALLPDPRPSLMQLYLNKKHPEKAPHMDDEDGSYEGTF
ncbi:MAG: hypothetical protein WC551_02565 [Patescibacteria group bacterium]